MKAHFGALALFVTVVFGSHWQQNPTIRRARRTVGEHNNKNNNIIEDFLLVAPNSNPSQGSSIVDGAVLELSSATEELSLEIISEPVFQLSVFFDGAFVTNLYSAPYVVSHTAFQPLATVPGMHTILVEAFAGETQWLETKTVTFTVVKEPAPTAAPAGPPPPVGNPITGFQLVNVGVNSGALLLENGSIVNAGTTMTIQVLTSQPVFQISMFWNGVFLTNDFAAPYSMTQDLTVAFGRLATPGTYTVEAEAFDESDAWLGTSSVTFVVGETSDAEDAGEVIQGLKVIDLADPGWNLGVLSTNSIIESRPTLTIEIVTTRPVFQVSMFFDNQFVVNDYEIPYALGLRTTSSSFAFQPLSEVGTHTLLVEVFDEGDKWLESKSVTFQVSKGTISPPAGPTIIGELRKWHKITTQFTGPYLSETSANNPFLNYRLDVTFTHGTSGRSFVVPGYFAADGNAANSGASEGNVWHCHFAPDATGSWTYQASFVSGPTVAVADSAGQGSTTWFHGQGGSFFVEPTNKTGRDHRGSGFGRLQYVGEHHLQFAEGKWFLKAGADSPENLLAYEEFDNTFPEKSWFPHKQDFRSGDPTWKGGKGTGLIGAINYLSDQGMNAFSFLTMSIEGDAPHAFPYISSGERTRIDVSKTAQWEIVFEHADHKGMFLHFKTQETENDQLLDGGFLGTERKLYYRELVARFGHHLALNWNLGEEITNTIDQIKSFADHFEKIDPYQHPVVTHTGLEETAIYESMLGHPTLDGASIQVFPESVFAFTLRWCQDSDVFGKKWVVANDEQGGAETGVLPDADDFNHDRIRQLVLWGNIMAGGAGVEYYFGYAYTCNDLTCQDYRSRANMWVQSRYALEFFAAHTIPFWKMRNENWRVPSSSNDWILANSADGVIVVYRRNNWGEKLIDMSGLAAGSYAVHWYNPRSGGALQQDSVRSLTGDGGSSSSLSWYGAPPSDGDKDWAILIRKQ